MKRNHLSVKQLQNIRGKILSKCNEQIKGILRIENESKLKGGQWEQKTKRKEKVGVKLEKVGIVRT